MGTWVISANRTDDGAVIYLAGGGRWVTALHEAEVLATENERDERLARAKGDERHACDPYAVDVHVTDGGVSPTSARERIRAEGAEIVLARLGLTPDTSATGNG